MSNDINHLDSEDLGLKAIFGDRFHDETCEKKPAEAPNVKAATAEKSVVNMKDYKKNKAVDAKWEPVKAITSADKLKGCAKWAAVFGGLNGLLFYWQQAGLLASEAAVPSMVVCALLAGLSIGWHAK